ncbi:MAG TPA: hypothetical protein VHB99_04360 [Pirellulales bacterium]|nr:hypothetical protein [Pirellulales bacterium]
MKALRRGLLQALAIAIGCCCPAQAQQQAQRNLGPLPRDVLINDLPGAQEAIRVAAPKTSLEQFCERLDGELGFVARACRLTPEERAKLDEVRGVILGRFKPLLDRQAGPAIAGAERMVAVNGQVVILDARGAAELLVPDRIIQSQVELAAETVLSKERRAALAAERQRMEEKSRQAHVLALAAAVDEAMLLRDDQLERFYEYLADNWRPVWGQVAAGQLSAPRATPLQSAKARGLGGVFDLFDADLEPLLRPAQMAAWREMRTLRVDQTGQKIALPNGLLLKDGRVIVQNAGALQVFRNANGEGILIQQGGAKVRVMLPIQPAPAASGRPLAEAERASPNHPPIVEPPKELAMLLELLVADAALAAELSEAERETLVLAGKLDINRYRAERETELRERFEHADEAPGNEKPRVQTETAAAWNPFADAKSRFRKALASRLSEEQLKRLTEVERKRRQRCREAAVQSLVREFDERARLTSEQWDALADVLRRRLPPLSGDDAEADASRDALVCISQLGKGEVWRVVDPDQWPLAVEKLNELKKAAIRRQAK